MAERYVSFRIGKETSLGSEVVPTENKNPFTDGTLIFAYNDKYNHSDASAQIVDGRLYVDATIDSNNYRFPINSECSYFLINSEDGKDFEMGNTGRPVYFSGGIPQPIDYVSTAYGGTGLTSFNANRMVWTASTSALSTSGHYVDADHFAVNSETLPSYNFYVSGTSGFSGGHLYLTGAQGSSSVNNTTQIVFGTPSNNHVAISSNTSALIINPSTSGTDNQIVLYLNQQSRFPNGIICGDDDTVGSINTNGDIIAAGGLNVGGATALDGNLSVTGTTAMQGNITITNGNPYVKLVDTANSNQVYYIQGYQGKFAFGPTFASAIQTDASGNMTLPSGATITPRADNTGSIGSSSYEWNQGFFRNIQSEDTFNLSAASNVSFSSTTGIIQFNQSGAESGRFNGSGELQLVTAVRPAARGSATSGSADYAWSATYTNYLYIQDAANNYSGGQFYTTSSTSTTSQPTCLIIGNAINTGTAGSRYGLIRLYATTNEYTDIRARENPAYNKSVFYLPAGEAASDSCYAVWNPNSATAVGGSGQPVYVDATGKVVGITTLTSGYGGTGVASHTANRLVWSTSATTIQATDNHFVNAEKLAVNYASEPDYNFYVNGTSGFTDDIRVFNEGNIIYKINRKTSGGGEWAYSPFSIVGNDNVMFANIGVYGGADSMTYMYIGSGTYDATTNIRITPTGSLSIPGDQTITPQTDATGSVGTSSYEWNEGYFRSIKSGSTLYITPSSTLYLDSASGASLIFRPQGTEQARFNTSGQLQIKSTGAANATVIGPGTAGTFYFPNTGGTFVTHATRDTAVGGSTVPVYIAATGRATPCNMAASGDWWGALPVINTDGVIEVGKYIDFHTTDTGTTNYDYRLTATTSDLTGSGSLTATTFLKSTTYTSVGSYLTAGTYINAATGFGITQTAGSGSGISLYGAHTGTTPTYGLMFAKTATFGTLGGVTSDWATYFTMSNTATRGWIFRRGSTNVCSIDGTGRIYSYDSTTTSGIYHKVTNGNGTVGIYTSTNRGLYDFTRDVWIIYSRTSDSTTRVGTSLYCDSGLICNNGAVGSSIQFSVTRATDKKPTGLITYYPLGSSSATAYNLGRFYFTQYSYTADTYTRLEYYDRYYLPSVPSGKTANNTYEIFTSKSYSTLDGRYLKLNPASIELFPSSSAGHGGFIDFHYNGSSADYTSRIIESGSGILTINGSKIQSGTITTTRLIATATTDTAADSANSVALITGNPTGTHLEFDGNEIIAKSDGTTGTVLYLNSGGSYTQLYKVCVSTATYGSTLPSSGTTGQIFFKLI